MVEFLKKIKKGFEKENIEIEDRIKKINTNDHVEFCSTCKEEYFRIPKSKMKNEVWLDLLAVKYLQHFENCEK